MAKKEDTRTEMETRVVTQNKAKKYYKLYYDSER